MRALLAIASLALLTTALAGCANEDPERFPDGLTDSSPSRSVTGSASSAPSGNSSASATSTSTTSPSQNATASNGTNQPPTGVINVTINGTMAHFNLTGSDPDGDQLAWTLDFGDGNATNGTSLPASVPHNYTAAGNFSVNYTLSDGLNSTSYPFNITVGGAGGSTGVVVTGSTSQPGNPTTSAVTGANGCVGFNTGENGVDCVFGEIPAGLDGKPFVLVATTGAADYELWDSCAPTGTAVQGFGGAHEGELPAGVGCVIMWEYGTATGTFTFTVG
jgi:hypothetical protein